MYTIFINQILLYKVFIFIRIAFANLHKEL